MTVPVIKLDILKRKRPTQLYILYFVTKKIDLHIQVSKIVGAIVQNRDTPPRTVAMQWLAWSERF